MRALDEKQGLDATGVAEPDQEEYDSGDGKPLDEQRIRDEALDALRTYVASMNLGNFIVRASAVRWRNTNPQTSGTN